MAPRQSHQALSNLRAAHAESEKKWWTSALGASTLPGKPRKEDPMEPQPGDMKEAIIKAIGQA